MDAPLRRDLKTLINACQQFINIYLLEMSVNHSILPISTYCYISQSFSYQEKHVVRSFCIA